MNQCGARADTRRQRGRQCQESGLTKDKTPWRTNPHRRQHVVDRHRVLLLFLAANFYLTWYPTYLAGTSWPVVWPRSASGARFLLSRDARATSSADSCRIMILSEPAAPSWQPRCRCARVLAGRRFLIPAAMVADTTTSILCLAHVVFLSGMGDRACVGRADGCRRRVQRNRHRHDEHGRGAGGLIHANRVRRLFGRGYWVAPFLVSAAVLALGAMIWIFLIDPDRSVVDS